MRARGDKFYLIRQREKVMVGQKVVKFPGEREGERTSTLALQWLKSSGTASSSSSTVTSIHLKTGGETTDRQTNPKPTNIILNAKVIK